MLNKVHIIGNVGKKPELRYTPKGTMVSDVNIVTNEKRPHDVAEWHKVVAWGKLAESISTLEKGRLVYVEGNLETQKWLDKDGVKHYTTHINAERIQFL